MAPTKEKEIRLNIRISEKLRDEFRATCARQCINGSELVRRFIEEWTAKNKQRFRPRRAEREEKNERNEKIPGSSTCQVREGKFGGYAGSRGGTTQSIR